MAERESDVNGSAQAAPESSDDTTSPPGAPPSRARRSVEAQAEEARRLVLGARSRFRPPRVAPSVTAGSGADAGELGDILRRLAGDVEEETQRLRDEAAKVRSEAERAATALHQDLQRAAEAMAQQSAEEVDREVVPTVTEAVANLTEQLVRLEMVASTLFGAVERLAALGPAVDRLAALGPAVERVEAVVPAVKRLERVAAQPAPQMDAGPLADALGELSRQLTAVSGAIREQVEGAVEQALIADARRRDAAMTQALALLADEFVHLREQLPTPAQQPAGQQPATKRPPAKKRAQKKQAAPKRAPRSDADAGTDTG